MVTTANTSLVLIVDDVPANIAIVSGALKSDGYRLKVATGGEKALETAADERRPDLILLDVMMPEIDGYEVCRRLKADPATREIPVIFLTALTDSRDEEAGFEAGAVDYIHKPFSPPIVRARVKTHLALQAALDGVREAVTKTDQALAREQAAHKEVEQARQQLALLSQISSALASSLDYETTLESVCHLAVPTLADWCTVDTLAPDGSTEYIAAAHADPGKEALVLALRGRNAPGLDDLVPVARVLETGRTVVTPRLDVPALRAMSDDAEVARLVRELGPVSVLALPLRARDRTLGVLTLVSTNAARRYDDSDLLLVEEVARRCALAVDNARMYRHARSGAEEPRG